VSRAVADDVPGACVVPNPYRHEVFRAIPGIARTKDLIFVGRLVSDKGGDVLLRAMALLKKKGLTPGLTYVGSGPEEATWAALAEELAIGDQVRFVGRADGERVAHALSEHRILVVPSRWAEPFGIVALEGIACGCVVVASEGGGLTEAVGDCGITVPNGDAEALAAALDRVLRSEELQGTLRGGAARHLAAHRPDVAARGYLAILEQAVHARGARKSASRAPRVG
jgi:glycosyltransferase involved in cell wall biosynthesis